MADKPKMKSMKLTKSDQKKRELAYKPSKEQYPWGLRLELNEEACKKLPAMADVEAGQEVMLMAKAKVKAVRASDTEDGGKNRSVELQITDLAVQGDAKDEFEGGFNSKD